MAVPGPFDNYIDFLGVGKSIEGVKLIRSSITKPSSLSRMTIWIRQRLGKV